VRAGIKYKVPDRFVQSTAHSALDSAAEQESRDPPALLTPTRVRRALGALNPGMPPVD